MLGSSSLQAMRIGGFAPLIGAFGLTRFLVSGATRYRYHRKFPQKARAQQEQKIQGEELIDTPPRKALRIHYCVLRVSRFTLDKSELVPLELLKIFQRVNQEF